jgi:hypothetical protein
MFPHSNDRVRRVRTVKLDPDEAPREFRRLYQEYRRALSHPNHPSDGAWSFAQDRFVVRGSINVNFDRVPFPAQIEFRSRVARIVNIQGLGRKVRGNTVVFANTVVGANSQWGQPRSLQLDGIKEIQCHTLVLQDVALFPRAVYARKIFIQSEMPKAPLADFRGCNISVSDPDPLVHASFLALLAQASPLKRDGMICWIARQPLDFWLRTNGTMAALTAAGIPGLEAILNWYESRERPFAEQLKIDHGLV